MSIYSGRSAVVTGGARGIGAATARALVKEGIGVVIGDILDTEGLALADELGANATYVHLDVTQDDDWIAALDTAEDRHGPLAILVNNAGILVVDGVADIDREVFRHVLDVNLYGPFLGMRSAAPYLRRAAGGVVVNISSTAG
jgi:3alpha(or 20beta)-hydroxysteroid dehydrogenase